ncbi:MAG: transcription termination/antitermination protein NusA, partial [Clostridia bacterium]|nr:transcription termination/antitermination protein NusA [Clostridia bacterium]
EKKLSLAIGKGGHNVRLAAKLTGYKIDVKPTNAKEQPKANDVVSTGSANIILDDDFFSDIDE